MRVQGGHTPQGPGGIYFVDVFERRASMFESLFPWIHTGATLVPANLIVPPGVSDSAARQADLREMTISQKVAAAVALRRLGYKVVAKPSGVIVAAIDASSHAIGKLQPSDLIVAVNGAPTPTIAGLRTQLAKVKAGDTVTLDDRSRRPAPHGSRQDDRRPAEPEARDHRLRARAGGDDQAAAEGTDRRAATSAGRLPGSRSRSRCSRTSATDVDRGYKVAATGEIELNGAVGPIGGIKQKTYGVREAKADVFLVPVGNAASRPPLRARAPDHRCEEFSPGVARTGNTAPKALENGIFRQPGNCRKFVSFRLRQRLLRAGSALVSPRSPRPASLDRKDK